jgi:uroporphyrinogen decarboxylase
MMTSREVVVKTIRFEGPDRFAYDFPAPYGSDFAGAGMTPSPDARPSHESAVDEWGVRWRNIGVSSLGQPVEPLIKDWSDFKRMKIPDISEPRRWETLKDARQKAGDKFLIAYGISLYERTHFLRGQENTWADIYEAPDMLGKLIDVLVEMNLFAVKKFAEAGADALMWCDDWGLQDRLMIPPQKWREIWKPRYARVYEAAHRAGLANFLHSCGYIVPIMDDLIEIGLDVIHMDQQENMGLELLGERFGGRITFWAPVDIQKTMARGNPDEIRAYCRAMVKHLHRHPMGGFIPRWYSDPKGAGHTQEAIDAMCKEFLAISRELYGK